MADLIAHTSVSNELPVQMGSMTLTDMQPRSIQWVSPFRGRRDAVEAQLKTQTGLDWPAPNRSSQIAEKRAIWFAQDEALLLNATPFQSVAFQSVDAAIVDVSDAWACMCLEGPCAQDAMARLVPIDLRPDHFETGHVARTLIGHMNGVVLRRASDAFVMMVARSMTDSFLHEVQRAMRLVTARRDLEQS